MAYVTLIIPASERYVETEIFSIQVSGRPTLPVAKEGMIGVMVSRTADDQLQKVDTLWIPQAIV